MTSFALYDPKIAGHIRLGFGYSMLSRQRSLLTFTVMRVSEEESGVNYIGRAFKDEFISMLEMEQTKWQQGRTKKRKKK